jgi:hypothetical protein
VSKAPLYVYETDVLEGEVAAVARMYAADPSAAHIAEDRLLEAFVRDVAWAMDQKQAVVTRRQIGERAMILVDLLNRERTRRFG